MLQLSADWFSKLLSGLLQKSGHMVLRNHMGKWAKVFSLWSLLASISCLSECIKTVTLFCQPATIIIIIHSIILRTTFNPNLQVLLPQKLIPSPFSGFYYLLSYDLHSYVLFVRNKLLNLVMCLTDNCVRQHATHWLCGSRLPTVAVGWSSYLNSWSRSWCRISGVKKRQ